MAGKEFSAGDLARRNKDITERIAFLKQELKEHPEAAAEIEKPADVPGLNEEAEKLREKIATMKRLIDAQSNQALQRQAELKESVKKTKAMVNWKKSELSKTTKQNKNAITEIKRIEASEDYLNSPKKKVIKLKTIEAKPEEEEK